MTKPSSFRVEYKIQYDDTDPSQFRTSVFNFRHEEAAMEFSRELDKVGRPHEVLAVYEFALPIHTSNAA